MQADTRRLHVGSRTGLFDFRLTDDVGVLVGCGLGGTSLINAKVSLEADRRVFDAPAWPAALQGGGDEDLVAGMAAARTMLGSTPYPDTGPALPKAEALRRAAARLEAPFLRPQLNVTFAAGPNAAGVHQPACTSCGDCITGCNVGPRTRC